MTSKHTDSPKINKNIHPPFVALFYLVAAMVLQKFIPFPVEMNALFRNIGLGLTFIAFLLGVGAFLEFRAVTVGG